MNDHTGCNLKALINALNSSNGTVSSDVARALLSLVNKGVFDEASLKPLIGLLLDSNKHGSHNSAFAIGDLAEFCAFSTFALRTLAKEGSFDTDAMQCLVGLFFDANKRVRRNLVHVIGYLA